MRLWSRSLLLWILRASGFFYASPSNFNYDIISVFWPYIFYYHSSLQYSTCYVL